MPYIMLRGHWCKITVLKVHAPTKDKIVDTVMCMSTVVHRCFTYHAENTLPLLLFPGHCPEKVVVLFFVSKSIQVMGTYHNMDSTMN
jgi:hypothetical protein